MPHSISIPAYALIAKQKTKPSRLFIHIIDNYQTINDYRIIMRVVNKAKEAHLTMCLFCKYIVLIEIKRFQLQHLLLSI